MEFKWLKRPPPEVDAGVAEVDCGVDEFKLPKLNVPPVFPVDAPRTLPLPALPKVRPEDAVVAGVELEVVC